MQVHRRADPALDRDRLGNLGFLGRPAARLGKPRAFTMYPDFLGIVAQKSGTTWLHDKLWRHPQVWLPPIKELHHLGH